MLLFPIFDRFCAKALLTKNAFYCKIIKHEIKFAPLVKWI